MKKFLSGLIAGMITFGTAFIALLTDMRGGVISDINGIAFLVCVLGGVLASLKDWQALMSEPPSKRS